MTVDLEDDEVMLLQDAVAAEMARYLMHWVDDPGYRVSYEALMEAGRKLGLEL
jgi:hypothetical protein